MQPTGPSSIEKEAHCIEKPSSIENYAHGIEKPSSIENDAHRIEKLLLKTQVS